MTRRLPPPPPKRYSPHHSPRPRSSALETARRLERGEREGRFDPERRGDWRGSSRDLVVNGAKLPRAGDDRILRYVDFDGYKLLTWDTYNRYSTGQHKIGYALFTPEGKLLFSGDDAGIAPSDPIDSDEALRSVIGWLTLRPGDTDAEYFERYTPAQMAFAEGPAEELQMWSVEPDPGEDWYGEFQELEWEGRPPVGRKTGMTSNAAAGDYLPQELRHVEFRYNDPPEENGDSVRYSAFESTRHAGGGEPKEGEWYLVGWATGSDYSGGSVTRSNYRVLEKLLEEHHPEGTTPAVWATTYGGHGTYGLLVVWTGLDESVQEALNALEDYPVLDEQDMSELENDDENEAWDRWAKDDFERAFIKSLAAELEDDDLDEWPDGVDSYELFRLAAEATNTYWEHSSEGPYIDLKRLVDGNKGATDIVLRDEVPSWVTTDQLDYLKRLDKALGLERKR